MSEITEVNSKYYNNLYSHHTPWLFRLHSWLSFDQQSKARPNLRFIMPVIRSMQNLRNPVRVLDYGCGWGSFLFSLPKRNMKLYGFDISTESLTGVRKVMSITKRDFTIMATDLEGHISESDLDIIVCSHVLEHVPSDTQLLSEFYKSLRDGGYLMINVPINEIKEDPKHCRTYTPEIVRDRLNSVGFSIESTQEICRWQVFLRKREVLHENNRYYLFVMRLLRLLLAVLPYSLISAGERLFLKHELPQQFLVLACANKSIQNA